jgi:hypothetical protein
MTLPENLFSLPWDNWLSIAAVPILVVCVAWKSIQGHKSPPFFSLWNVIGLLIFMLGILLLQFKIYDKVGVSTLIGALCISWNVISYKRPDAKKS